MGLGRKRREDGWLAAIVAALCVGACSPQVSSTVPLMARGSVQPRPGLWAFLDPHCPAPTSSHVETWRECATPVWLSEGTATLLAPGPKRARFLIDDGDPGLVQMTGSINAMSPAHPQTDPAFSYLAVAPGNRGAELTSARVYELRCPTRDQRTVRGLSVAQDGSCLATTLAAVRTVARAGGGGQVWAAVWVAPR